MGMPADGGSSWAHSADGYELIGDGDVAWGQLTRELFRPSLTFMLPYTGVFAHFFVSEVEVTPEGVMWKDRLSDGPPVRWTPSTPPQQLVSQREVYRRALTPRDSRLPDLHATLTANAGTVTVADVRGIPRLKLRLGDADPAWLQGVQGALTVGDRPAVSFWVPTGLGAYLTVRPLSSP
jgi:hypothetical protein